MCDDGETLIDEQKEKHYELYNNLNSINYAYQKNKKNLKIEILISLKEMRAVDFNLM